MAAPPVQHACAAPHGTYQWGGQQTWLELDWLTQVIEPAGQRSGCGGCGGGEGWAGARSIRASAVVVAVAAQAMAQAHSTNHVVGVMSWRAVCMCVCVLTVCVCVCVCAWCGVGVWCVGCPVCSCVCVCLVRVGLVWVGEWLGCVGVWAPRHRARDALLTWAVGTGGHVINENTHRINWNKC